jgi:hypothetical protein
MSPSSEAVWNDLYNGVVEMLGPDRAETLMTHLFRYDPSQIAMKTDIAAVKSDIAGLKADIAGLRSDISGLYRTLIGGFIVLTAAMIGVLFAAL